jgi:hypothetical protein
MSTIGKLLRRSSDERGVAMVTAILISMAVLSLSIVAVQISVHNSDSSTNDRRRTQAVHAAEAGLNQVLSFYRTATVGEVCLPPSNITEGALSAGATGQLAEFSVTITCDSLTSPKQVLLSSTGWAPSKSSKTGVARKMETLVNLKATKFLHAMFHGSSTTPLNLVNKTDGQQFLNADVYSNSDVNVSNFATISGDITSQGKVLLQNNALVKGSVWARYGVTMKNSAFVGGSVTASMTEPGKPGDISMNLNTRVAGNARAAGAITTLNSAKVDGVKIPNSPSPPPPYEDLPTFAWNPTDPWPQVVSTYNACTGLSSFDTWFLANKSALTGTGRIAGTGSQTNCTFTTANNSVMNIVGDFAIVNDGTITLQQQNTWQSGDGEIHNVYVISINGDINFSNNTNFDSKLRVFVFTNHTANLQNQNSWYGQVYADVIAAANFFPLTYHNLNPPGFTTDAETGFVVDTVYIREVKL